MMPGCRLAYRSRPAPGGTNQVLSAHLDLVLTLTPNHLTMARFSSKAWFLGGLVLLFVTGAEAGNDTYEPAQPPRIIAITADARSFYLEFRARNEVGGFGHSYITLGTVDASGQTRQTVVVGFMPRSADDDYQSKFGLPVTGMLGVTRSDLLRRPDARFRIAVNEAMYLRLVSKVRSLRRTWTQYELVVHNCNSFVSEIASSVGLRTPLITAQYPVGYVTELRTFNAPLISRMRPKRIL
jgi:hypothetical protein